MVDVGVERRQDECGKDDGEEVQEHEVVVVHDLCEEALGRLVGSGAVPTEQRQEAHQGPRDPAHTDDTYNQSRAGQPLSR